MGLKERLLARLAEAGNHGNRATESLVTEFSSTKQQGNHRNHGNRDLGKVEGESGEEAAGVGPDPEKASRDLYYNKVTTVTTVTALETKADSGNRADDVAVTAVTEPDPVEWQGEAEDVAPPKPEPAWWRPRPLPQASLHARLVAVGATVNTYGSKASVRAPAGIPADLLHEVEARGWRVIPGGRANPEALHDSWLAGVPIRELER